MFAGVLKTTTGTSFRRARTGFVESGEENSVRRNACNSPYCKGVRLRDSVFTRYTPTEPGIHRGSSSQKFDQSQPTRSPPILPVKADLPGTSRSPFAKSPSQGKGDAEKKTKPPPFGVKRPSGQSSGVREEDKQQSGAGGNPPKASATPPRPKGVPASFFPRPAVAEASRQGAMAKLGPKGSARPPTPLHPIPDAAPAVAPKMAPPPPPPAVPLPRTSPKPPAEEPTPKSGTSASFNWGYPPSWPAPPSPERTSTTQKGLKAERGEAEVDWLRRVLNTEDATAAVKGV